MSRLSNEDLKILIDLYQDNYCEGVIDYTIQRAVNELKKYRKLEEQGLVLDLPCKLGDTLHWFDGFGNYQHSIVNCIYIENGLDDIRIETLCCTFDASDLNKTVFLTKEELLKD